MAKRRSSKLRESAGSTPARLAGGLRLSQLPSRRILGLPSRQQLRRHWASFFPGWRVLGSRRSAKNEPAGVPISMPTDAPGLNSNSSSAICSARAWRWWSDSAEKSLSSTLRAETSSRCPPEASPSILGMEWRPCGVPETRAFNMSIARAAPLSRNASNRLGPLLTDALPPCGMAAGGSLTGAANS